MTASAASLLAPLVMRVVENADFGVFCVGKRGVPLGTVAPDRVLDVGRWSCYGTRATFVVFKLDNADGRFGFGATVTAYAVESEQTADGKKEVARLKKLCSAPPRPSGRDAISAIKWAGSDRPATAATAAAQAAEPLGGPFAAIVAELEVVAAGERELKRRSMVYQLDAKEVVAAFYGKPIEEVNLPFQEWMALRAKYERDSGLSL